MKQAIITLIFLWTGCLTVLSQERRLTKEEFQAKQKEYFSRQADLTHEEAARFFPLYFELQGKKGKLNQEAMEQMRKGKEDNLAEAEYANIVESILKSRIASDELELEYLRKYRKFLTARKIYQLQRAEMRFHRELLKGAKHGGAKKR